MKLLRASDGKEVSLASAKALGVGGEARIYAVLDMLGQAAKVYHRPTPERGTKLAAMLANPPEDPLRGEGHVSIAWPTELLLSRNGSGVVMGFLMPRVRGMSPIIDFYHPKTRRRRHPLFNYHYLLRTAHNLAACVAALHARNYVIGDLNESNILVDETALVTLVDTDSFQVPDKANSKVYRCRVGKPEFTPPELQSVTFAWVDLKPEHDLFGVAVLLFQLLMEGIHPFAGPQPGRDEPTPLEERIAAGWFPYAPGRPCETQPMPTAPSFSSLPREIRELFLRCFVEGHAEPSKRPTAQMWQQALQEAEGDLVGCSANEQHRYDAHLKSCPWCERKRLLGGLDPFPSRDEIAQNRHLQPALTPFAPRRLRTADFRTLDYETAVGIAQAAMRRKQRIRKVTLVACWLLGAALLVYWIWMLVLAFS